MNNWSNALKYTLYGNAWFPARYKIYNANGTCVLWSANIKTLIKNITKGLVNIEFYLSKDGKDKVFYTSKQDFSGNFFEPYNIISAHDDSIVGALKINSLKDIIVNGRVDVFDINGQCIGYTKPRNGALYIARRLLHIPIPIMIEGFYKGERICTYKKHVVPIYRKITISFNEGIDEEVKMIYLVATLHYLF